MYGNKVFKKLYIIVTKCKLCRTYIYLEDIYIYLSIYIGWNFAVPRVTYNVHALGKSPPPRDWPPLNAVLPFTG